MAVAREAGTGRSAALLVSALILTQDLQESHGDPSRHRG